MADKKGYWFSTEKGAHIYVEEGQSKEEALKQRFGDKKDKNQDTKKEEIGFEEAPKELQKQDSKEYKSLEKQRDGLQSQIQGLKKRLEQAKTKDAKEAIQRGIDARKERINKVEKQMLKEKKANNSLYIPQSKALEMGNNF